jgi:hypothetical protein
MIAPSISFIILLLFLWGMGRDAFFPSLRLLLDTQWDLSLFPGMMGRKMLSLCWLVPIGLGLMGWVRVLRVTVLRRVEPPIAFWTGLALSVVFFSFFVFGLAVNGILSRPLVILFFIPMVILKPGKVLEWFSDIRFRTKCFASLFLTAAGLLWMFEYLSPPLIWDAVLDHFNYAREVARLHQIPFHWTNHTGEMPKLVELILAGFWSLGGESLAKLSIGLAALLMVGFFSLMTREWKGENQNAHLMFWTCPFFLALFSWGYVEGFLAVFEMMALYFLWKALAQPKMGLWIILVAFFLGAAFSVKYTAALAIGACLAIWAWDRGWLGILHWLNWKTVLFFLLPCFPWLFKNYLANGNPFYPLAVFLFGGPPGYDQVMESALWQDTGSPADFSFFKWANLLWNSFFTSNNGVAAAWSPLAAMSLPWFWFVLKKRTGLKMGMFALSLFLLWLLFCTNLRHAAAGMVVLAVMGALAWQIALKKKGIFPRCLFTAGLLLSLWLMVSAQLTVTAPYASALGLEDPLQRLRRHYSSDFGTFSAYQFIENNSDSSDKIMAFAVFQTYPLQRTAFIDFKWRMPIFLKWASSCRTAEELAAVLKKQGVSYFLFQEQEASAMSKKEKDFRLEGMPLSEYDRFWKYFMEPVADFGNACVFRSLVRPSTTPNKRSYPKFESKRGMDS